MAYRTLNDINKSVASDVESNRQRRALTALFLHWSVISFPIATAISFCLQVPAHREKPQRQEKL